MSRQTGPWPMLFLTALMLAGCEGEPTDAQRHRDNVRCGEFAAGVPAEQYDAAYKRCMEGGPGRFRVPEDAEKPN